MPPKSNKDRVRLHMAGQHFALVADAMAAGDEDSGFEDGEFAPALAAMADGPAGRSRSIAPKKKDMAGGNRQVSCDTSLVDA